MGQDDSHKFLVAFELLLTDSLFYPTVFDVKLFLFEYGLYLISCHLSLNVPNISDLRQVRDLVLWFVWFDVRIPVVRSAVGCEIIRGRRGRGLLSYHIRFPVVIQDGAGCRASDGRDCM